MSGPAFEVTLMRYVVTATTLFLLAALLQSCSEDPVSTVDYQPLDLNDGWRLSSAEEQGVDPAKLSAAYEAAARLSNIYSLLVAKNGYLIAERYYNGRDAFDPHLTASATKSYTSVLLGIALRENVLTSLDQTMMGFFPEFAGQPHDPEKDDITVRDLITMRSGYPNDSESPYIEMLRGSSDWLPYLLELPLQDSPGTTWAYSNLSAHLVAVLLARAANTTLLDFAQAQLFGEIDVVLHGWPRDANGYYYGSGDMQFTTRDMARFGLLYLNQGVLDGRQVVPAEWIEESWGDYSVTPYSNYGSYFRNCRYGYLWWHADVGVWDVHYAAGHGGQIIAVVPELNMVVISTADSQDYGDSAWPKERAMFDLVGRFVASLQE
jgi:CubicO group peptidase (beta-lactamase class C family)